jgi:hypothetical protein
VLLHALILAVVECWSKSTKARLLTAGLSLHLKYHTKQ